MVHLASRNQGPDEGLVDISIVQKFLPNFQSQFLDAFRQYEVEDHGGIGEGIGPPQRPG
jgi:hypothetical protein